MEGTNCLNGRIVRWISLSVFAGLALAGLRYPFFIGGTPDNWELPHAAQVEATLLVIASLLIGVTVIQGQNLNRMLDIHQAVKSKKAQPTENYKQVYDLLRIGFWVLSIDVLFVLGLLALTSFMRGPYSGAGWELSNSAAFILATAWWSVITLIVAGWIALAWVAKLSYVDR